MAFIVLTTPNAAEFGSYQRQSVIFEFKTNTLTFTWKPQSGMGANSIMLAQLVIDGQPVGEAIGAVNGGWTFTVTVPDGHHLVSLLPQFGGYEVG
jgi:hypothetical protein